MNIPTMKDLHNQVAEYIKNNQGEKGYIETQDQTCDSIYCYAFNEDYYFAHKIDECIVLGVRVNKLDRIEVCYEFIFTGEFIRYSEDDFKNAEWVDIESDELFYVPTLMNIAESIEEY